MFIYKLSKIINVIAHNLEDCFAIDSQTTADLDEVDLVHVVDLVLDYASDILDQIT